MTIYRSHLDSVEAGPGINDNGSGSSMNLQVALELRNHNAQPTNKVFFDIKQRNTKRYQEWKNLLRLKLPVLLSFISSFNAY